MIKSMTGFGRANSESEFGKLSIEIRSLNSKFLDLSFKLPKEFSDFEYQLRADLNTKLERGKINILIEKTGVEKEAVKSGLWNSELIDQYVVALKQLSFKHEIDGSAILSTAFSFPKVFDSVNDNSELEWQWIKQTLEVALKDFDSFRIKEGKNTGNELRKYCERILALLNEITPFEQERVQNIKDRIFKQLLDNLGNDGYDKSRFEQELLYYLEKIDISEEKVRLLHHCEFFINTLSDETSNGKKLGFITQEMGREINTIGSKANNLHIQQRTVEMKNELEKIKEQVLNIL